MTFYYRVPFGAGGDRTAIPVDTQGDGSVSYTEGYGDDYSKSRLTDPAALTIPRDQFNQALFDITTNLQQYQQFGFPNFISSSDNGGTAFPYAINATVRYTDGVNYTSLVGSNTALPTDPTKWRVESVAATADKLTTARLIYGESFDGTAALTGIIAATFGGTGNGFTQFTGAATSTKTYTLPNANATILTDNALVSVAQGGTGSNSLTAHAVLIGNGTAAPASVAPGTSGNVLTSNGTDWVSTAPSGVAPTFGAIFGLYPTSISGAASSAAISIAAGQAASNANTAYISGGSFSWSVTNGNAANGYQGGSTLPNNTTLHMFIMSGTSGVASFGSASLTPTLPTGYTIYRRIFSVPIGGTGSPIPFTAIESEGGSLICWLNTQQIDVSAQTLTTANRTLYALGGVPTGIKMQWLYRTLGTNVASSGYLITSGDESDIATQSTTVGTTTPPGADSGTSTNGQQGAPRDGVVTTNTSGQIGMRAASASVVMNAFTRGFKDFRRI